MKERPYKSFSLRTHLRNIGLDQPSACQFELTFRCGFHCPHCYTSCYDRPRLIDTELDCEEVKAVLDRLHEAGILWVCFTGGDPLARPDFREIYLYARAKGFLVTLFTNGWSLDAKLIETLKRHPPFSIEITLNAAEAALYERISGVKGSFRKVLRNIRLAQACGLPLKIKSLVTSQNAGHVKKLKAFIVGMGQRFRPDSRIYARLDGDRAPCALRVAPQRPAAPLAKCGRQGMLRCAIGSTDSLYVDPRGDMILCSLIRGQKISILRHSVKDGMNKLRRCAGRISALKTKCLACAHYEQCPWCPGQALVETGSFTRPIRYYCEAAGK